MLFGLLFGFLIGIVSSKPTGDIVDGTAIPGWEKTLPSTMYSGFLDVGPQPGKRLHYIFVESERNPTNDPVVLWLNGGPGCSSLEGFMYEHGPILVSDAHNPPNINFDGKPSSSRNTTQLVENPWSWSKVANVLYLEAPAGVGFSYSKNKKDLNTGDNQTASDNLQALHYFF